MKIIAGCDTDLRVKLFVCEGDGFRPLEFDRDWHTILADHDAQPGEMLVVAFHRDPDPP